MNDGILGNIRENNDQPLVDFNYNKQKNRGARKSMFQVFSPKINLKKNMNNNPRELFKASNKINSILSKNLKSIFNENKNEINQDIPLYENVNCMIQRNNNSNKFLYNQILNFKKELNNKKYVRKESSNTFISNNSGKEFRDSTLIRKMDKYKKNNLFQTSIKSGSEIKKKLEKFQSNNSDNSFISNQTDSRITNNIKEKKNYTMKKRNSSFANSFKFNRKFSPSQGAESFLLKEKERLSKFFKDSPTNARKRFSNAFEMYRINSRTPKNKKSKNIFTNKNNNFKPNFSSKRYSLKMVNNNRFKINSKLKDTRHSLFINSTQKNMKIPTLRQINSAVAKTLISSKIEGAKKELDDFNNNEISEIISQLPKNKNEKKRTKSLARISFTKTIDLDKSEKNELLKETMPLKEQIELQRAIEEDRFQKKYRKLFLNRNLYDSLDDEEAIDMEEIYIFHISPNSVTAYFLDSLILIASLIELIYLPIYIALYISSFAIHYNIISSTIFYSIDIIYIIDLITGFFRAYYNFEEILIKKNIDICINYLSGWFILDLIEAFPFFTLLDKNMKNSRKNFLNLNEYNGNLFDFGLNNRYFALTFVKLLKIFKTFGDNRVLNALNKLCDKIHFLYEWKGLFSTLLITFSTLNFCTCFFIFVGKNEAQGWIIQNNLQDKGFMDLYIASLYYLMTTLTTVGYGDISSYYNNFEIIFGIFILIVGTCAYSWILTYISNYIKKNNEKFIDFEEKMKILSEIKLDYPNLDKNLYDRIKRYLNYNKSEYKLNLKFILESLPSSLQNNLIIEIYKPIIQNFQFFKSFENSDFFVKIVTSMKPILSMKDDILIQEGDIIEDIIFIKKGLLTLEIIMDLNDPKKSVESHLEMTKMECFKNISNNKLTAFMNMNTMNSSYNSEFGQKIYSDKYAKKKEIKIIDLRKNEHFGDILMILNEKSPVAVKVKSKKAELFFLQKTEATEISNRYSNIWKRIVNRSLHNMKQIKNLIRKKVFLFIETYNIEINPELKEKYSSREESNVQYTIDINKKFKNSENIETIIEEDESIKSQSAKSEKNINQSTNEQTKIIQIKEANEDKNIKEEKIQMSIKKENVISFRDNDFKSNNKMDEKNYIKNKSFTKINKQNSEKNEAKFLLKNMKKNKSFKEEKPIVEFNNNNINGVNEMINIIDKEVKKSNKKNQINNFNINIYTPKVQFPLNQINIENPNPIKYNKDNKEDINDSYNLGKINSEISYNNEFITNDIKYNGILMDNSDANSNLFYSNIKFMDNKTNKNSNITENYNSNIIKLLKNKKNEITYNKKDKNEKTEIKTEDKISIRSLSSNKSKLNLKNQYNIKNEKNRKFSDLDSSQSTSFTINSSYDNINQISNYKYYQNSELREQTKNFILEQINDEKSDDTSNINNNKSNQKINSNYIKKLSPKKPLKKKLTDFEESNIIARKRNLSLIKKSLVKAHHNRFDSQINIHNVTKKIDTQFSSSENQKNGKKFNSVINEDKKGNNIKKKRTKRQDSIIDGEKTFYNKINRKKTTKKKKENNPPSEERSEREHAGNKMNYDKLISKNIEKNQQNLNNPEEYFEGFFNDIIFKKNQNKSNKISDNGNIKGKKTFDG